jgi:hypothetical protein
VRSLLGTELGFAESREIHVQPPSLPVQGDALARRQYGNGNQKKRMRRKQKAYSGQKSCVE